MLGGMKKLLLTLALVVLAVASFGVSVGSPASASPNTATAPAVVDHGDSAQASAVCAASIPTGFGSAPGDVVIHAHLAGVGFGWSYYSCESWNFGSGSASHGCQFHGWWINGTGPFGPESNWVCY